MINCPSCRMSNLGGTNCTYCKAALPAEEDVNQAYASVTFYAEVPSAMSATEEVETTHTVVGTVTEPDRESGTGGGRPAPAPVEPKLKKKTAELKPLDALREYEKRKEKPSTTERERRAVEESPRPRRKRSGPFTTEAVLSAVLPGLGQVAKGMPERGFLFLAAIQFTGLFQWTWLLIPIWGFNIYDAYTNEDDSVGERLRRYLGEAIK